MASSSRLLLAAPAAGVDCTPRAASARLAITGWSARSGSASLSRAAVVAIVAAGWSRPRPPVVACAAADAAGNDDADAFRFNPHPSPMDVLTGTTPEFMMSLYWESMVSFERAFPLTVFHADQEVVAKFEAAAMRAVSLVDGVAQRLPQTYNDQAYQNLVEVMKIGRAFRCMAMQAQSGYVVAELVVESARDLQRLLDRLLVSVAIPPYPAAVTSPEFSVHHNSKDYFQYLLAEFVSWVDVVTSVLN